MTKTAGAIHEKYLGILYSVRLLVYNRTTEEMYRRWLTSFLILFSEAAVGVLSESVYTPGRSS